MKNQGQKTQQPPRLATRLFFWMAGSAAIEDLYGDMEEIYFSNVDKYGKSKANRIFWKQVLSLVFSYALKSRKANAAQSYRSGGMSTALLINFSKVSMRSLIRHKTFSFINIIGLAFGMSICLLAITMWHSVNNFDNFHINKDQIFRINSHITNNKTSDKFATTAPYVIDQVSRYTQQVEHVVGINDGFAGEAQINNNQMPISGLYVPPSFLEVFTFPLLAGDAASALEQPFSIILTEKTATRLFGHTDVVGKNLEISDKGTFQITGLMKDYPRSSHVLFESIVSYQTLHSIDRQLNKRFEDYRFYTNSYTYLQLKQGVDPSALDGPLKKMSNELTTEDERVELYLQPVTNIASGENINYGIGPSFDPITMSLFFLLTLLILLPACFNYASLSLARALKRAKEIGLRKVVGGGRRDIFIQFLFETLIITSIALIGAIYIFTVIRSHYQEMLVEAESIDLNIYPVVLVTFLVFGLLTSLAAGIIPASYFSKMSVLSSLKGNAKAGGLMKIGLKNGLTVFQFCLCTFFIFGAIAMSTQYYHTLNYDKGFDEKGKVVVPLYNVEPKLLAHEFSLHSEVKEIAFSSSVPGSPARNEIWATFPNLVDSIVVAQMFVDNAFIKMMNFDIQAGTIFEEDLNNESEIQIIANETFVQRLGLNKNQIVGESIQLDKNLKGRIIGVVQDFNHLPINKQIKPFFFRYDPDQFAVATIQVHTNNVFDTATKFEASWEKLNELVPYEFKFLEEKLDEAYEHMKNPVKIFGFLSFLAVSISCLGLLGMVVFTMENKLKEIGIRKVMGASVSQMTYLLSKSFLKLMLISAIIAIPLAFAFFEFMLSQIVYYHDPLGIFEISTSILILSILGGGTIMSQTTRAAKLNPVDNLRYE